jgi:hypothetical protein
MTVRWKKMLVVDSGDQIFWKRDGYNYVGTVVDAPKECGDSYYVEYQLDPRTKSWTDVDENEIDLMRMHSYYRHHIQ